MGSGYPPGYFWTKVEKTAGCWLWRGYTWKGYGRSNGVGAHRVAYEELVGPIPSGLELDHLCREPLCVRPDHLEPVTRAENMRRRSAAMTHCANGHEFTPENTYDLTRMNKPGGGRRSCRACNRAAVARYVARKVERVTS